MIPLLPRKPRPPVFVAALLATMALALPALAVVYWERGPLLGSFFASSKRVAPKRFALNDADAADIAKKLGVATVKRDWNVYVGDGDAGRDGYAILDAEIGLHEPIDFGVRFSKGGVIERVEIIEYREPFGDGVRSDRFREKFVGKTAKDPIEAGRDIDIVSGATYSSKSVALGVKRDALVLDVALKSGAL